MMNLEEIAALLHIEEKTRNHPKLKAIWTEAMKALEAHAQNHTKPEAEAPAPVAEEEKPAAPGRRI